MQDIVYKLVPGLQEGKCHFMSFECSTGLSSDWFCFGRKTDSRPVILSQRGCPLIFCVFPCAAEIKKQREFYQKLGMEVPGDVKGELCNMKTHLDQRNGTSHASSGGRLGASAEAKSAQH